MKIITLLSGVLVTNVLSMPCYTKICLLASAVGISKFLLMAQFHTESKFCVLHIILIVGLNIWAFFWGYAHPLCMLEEFWHQFDHIVLPSWAPASTHCPQAQQGCQGPLCPGAPG